MTNKTMPFMDCPYFNTCSCNKCPLDPDIDMRNKTPEDEKCRAGKRVRFTAGVKYPEVLKYIGLTAREWSGFQFIAKERGMQTLDYLKLRFLQGKENGKTGLRIDSTGKL